MSSLSRDMVDVSSQTRRSPFIVVVRPLGAEN